MPMGASVAAWLRHAMRRVTIEDFPESLQVEATASRSHDSGDDHRRFQLRLDHDTHTTLETFMETFHRSAAEIIRQFIAQVGPEDFPWSWHVSVGEPLQENDP